MWKKKNIRQMFGSPVLTGSDRNTFSLSSRVAELAFFEENILLFLMVFDKKVFSNTMRSKIKKIQWSVSNTLQLATRKNVIQMSSDINTMENCHY
jgi:hypothetical protein